MKLLAICIPNYNRIDKLRRLLEDTVRQILRDSLEDEVELCVSDDHSTEDPTDLLEELKKLYPQILFRYVRNEENQGMDYNFLNSVMLAESEYCWIIGNDDMPTEHGIRNAITMLRGERDRPDIFVTPFDIYTEADTVRATIWPLGNIKEQAVKFDTSDRKEYQKLLFSIQHNSGLFGFLSNTVFRREKWLAYREKFQDKLNTIFIQMYMNIQTLEDGALYLYSPKKIIKNYADDETNESITRICRILIGLNGVVEHFFSGVTEERLKKVIVDAYISGSVWELPEHNHYKKIIKEIETDKNKLYKKYFISPDERATFFARKEVVLFGAGNYGKKVLLELQQYEVTVVGVMDSDVSKIGQVFCGHTITTTEQILGLCREKGWFIVVANHFHLQDMIQKLKENDVDRIAIIS